MSIVSQLGNSERITLFSPIHSCILLITNIPFQNYHMALPHTITLIITAPWKATVVIPMLYIL